MGEQDISRPSQCRGAACGFVWHQQGPSCGWQGCCGQETPRQRSLCHAAAVDDGGGKAVARSFLPTLNGCHGVWLHSDCGMMDYDDGGPFCV